MPSIDDPIEQTRSQYAEQHESPATGLMKKLLSSSLPIIGPAFEYFQAAGQNARQEAFNNEVLNILAAHGKSIDELQEKLHSEEFIHTVAVAVERIFWGASSKKSQRFAAVVAYELIFGNDAQGFEDAAAFIRALDELSEIDLEVLSQLYRRQIFDHDSFYRHPDVILEIAGSVSLSLDGLYSRCGRLSGYGLVVQLERRPLILRENEFAFRITLMGRKLVEMLAIVQSDTA